ncbi:isoamylase early set domain-containing protein [Marinitoga sp. 38H-ov]|uniref:isoamylase early set domain-containing protein n=1 Tax=Marinitoga sp. 38H-ov TaxID=1755814 RepID=UPI0013EE3809|nr:isoamylase early set domain-containing protein [Marinitoga sp. 38H-ov]KAF2956583.1 hypothetical protein AS160_05140 [Marinitoga sp. 38H-ov]
MKKIIILLAILTVSIVSFSKVYIYNNNVVFEFKDLTASKVFLAGSFNNWDPSAHPMEKSKNGLWKIMLKLAPGDYQYKFVVNGTDWKEDPDAPGYTPDGFGGKNGAFSLILENGKLKIEIPEKQESGILSGSYAFDLKSKFDIEKYSLKNPEVVHEFNLIINPKKTGMNLEAVLKADNNNWQLELSSLKAVWENSNFKFGMYKNKAVNDLINFSENIEKENSGFFGVFKTNFINIGIDAYSNNNDLNYFLSSKLYLEKFYLTALFSPKTNTSPMNIYGRIEANGVGIEYKYTDKLEYILSDFSDDNIQVKWIYSFFNENISLEGNFYNYLSLLVDYTLKNNTYKLEFGAKYDITNDAMILFDMHYDNLNNLGYKIGYELKKENISVKFKLGHDFENDFENYYLYINATSKF